MDFNQSPRVKVKIKVTGDNRVGFVRDITDLIAKEKIIIDNLKADNPSSEVSQLDLTFSVDNVEIITDILRKITKIDGVQTVKRK